MEIDLCVVAPRDWEIRSVADVCERVTSGGTPSRREPAFYEGGTWPWVKTQELQDGWIDDTEEHITDRAINESSAKVLPANTILLAMYGATVGQLGILRRPMTCNQACCALIADPQKADFRFLYYQLLQIRSELKSLATGAAQQNLSGTVIKSLRLPFPKIQEQRAIAQILGTLDDKIELNRKQNETLEAMARALFKAWFVDFEPVRAKMEGRWRRGETLPGLPAHLYDLFPDRLVESELGEIPEGWRVFSFGDVAQQGKGAVNPTDEPGERFTHYSIPAFDASKMPVIELGGSIKSNKTPVPDGAVLVSKLNPHIPRVWLVGQAGDMAVCSTEFIVWTPKSPANSAFLYCLASSSEFVESMCQLVTGTSNSHQRVKPDQLREIRVFAANENVIAAFSNMVEALMNQVLQNSRQSRTIAQLRDTLLPKLISGELRVPGAEAFLGERGL